MSSPRKQGLYDPAFEHDACGMGFVAHIKGTKSHDVVRDGLVVLNNLNHRGACGCEANTGDGAGILLQIPHKFYARVTAKEGFSLPSAGRYGVGMTYMPRDAAHRQACEDCLGDVIRAEGQTVLGWRTVPTDNRALGAGARAAEPVMRQVFVGRDASVTDDQAFERKLYVIRRRVEKELQGGDAPSGDMFYVPSFSARTVVYKGMLLASQMEDYFPDLNERDVESALALVHSRFSTNTFPNWARAHPYRYVIHNGEINTLRGNINWMHAREAQAASSVFGADLEKVLPVIDTDGSDSGMFDNALEFLTLGGYSLPHAMMMMIPEPWANHESMPDAKKAFYEFHSCLMEPWDGPASMGFTDGIRVGAVLDRNGLRPSRYVVTTDDRVVLASEAGVLDIAPENVLHKGRLQPGRMLLIDTAEGRIVSDGELKGGVATARPYRQWLDTNMIVLADLPPAPAVPLESDHQTVLRKQQAFGYTYEDLRVLLEPMAKTGLEAVGSMGTDTPLAVLSNRPQLIYNYFKQLFAQVTNPPIDAIREEIITSVITTLGAEGNLLDPDPSCARLLKLASPLLTNEDMATLRRLDKPGFKPVTLPILYDPAGGENGLRAALEDLFHKSSQAVKGGATILILSDRGMDAGRAPIPALLAVAGVHHHLISEGTRTRVGLALESGEPREVHHFALLLGYGAGAINPYLAYETLADMVAQNMLNGMTYADAAKKYVKAAVKGVVKTLSKMGISTVQSYRGAQIFEAVGLRQDVVDEYFTWTPSRLGGVGLDVIAEESRWRHAHAFPERSVNGHTLDVGGEYQWRQDGEVHLFNPETVHRLQLACRTNNPKVFREYSQLVDKQDKTLYTLRGLLDLKPADTPVPLDEVESVESLCRRFKTGAMSYGSISQEAHETLAVAMNRLGGKSNTGEGGEDPERYKPLPNGDSKNSAIKQVASGRFGVTSLYLVNAKELQIKMAQGAKPGEGGQLPGSKVYPWVAKVRHTTAGVGLISPPPHHDIYSIEDLAELIHDLKNANTQARISVKLVAEVGVGTVAAGVAKAHADVILISGYDGGTGASPQSSIKHAGVPWELGLAETHQTLLLNNLRSRVVLETDGQLKTGRDVVIAALLGAEEFGFATAPLVVMGCVMMRVCHLNTCPVGVATQDPKLRKKFTGDPSHVVAFMRFIAQEAREHMARMGFRTLEEMVGRVDRLEARTAVDHWKAKGLDLSSILYQPKVGPEVGRTRTQAQDHGLDKSLDQTKLLELCRPALEKKQKVKAVLPIRNSNRVVGTQTGSELTRRYGAKGLPDDTIDITFQGSAGQSFGAFIPRGMTLRVEGDANDYFGKGLSGGKLIVYPPEGSTFVPEENIIVGNVAFYGASSGEAYIRGLAGERFCVRNSGVHAVVEGVGDHGCEYMTGGRVVILGSTGRNFAAGMSGGVAFVFDEKGDFAKQCNMEMVALETPDADDLKEIENLLRRHGEYTASRRAAAVLAGWPSLSPKFVKVMPRDYKRMIQAIKTVHAAGLTGEEAILAAFEENARDLARAGGN
jgi:glutamate synthase (ferredoxin)